MVDDPGPTVGFGYHNPAGRPRDPTQLAQGPGRIVKMNEELTGETTIE
jgi:hypothetical protein